MIRGFLHRKGRDILDGEGRRILLSGWGLGNWLLQEGYMWLSSSPGFDRPRRIERVIGELAGEEYAKYFWREYRENYIRREDILRMAQLGYNSVRIPLHYRVFMEDGEPLRWKEEGFQLLDRCLSWCEEVGIYAFLDLHGAPGGQTGANIDDSKDDTPGLFLERGNRERCVALWVRLAKRYCDREVVGGYDLLNEPLAPTGFDFLIPELASLYEELIRAIRRVDRNHLLSLEGAHWATDLSVFDRRYDENMVLHFHRYAEIPDLACLEPYRKKAGELDVPLWLGETGENRNEWYAALCSLSHSLGIGYNLWPWKKMECVNSPYSIRRPPEYGKLLRYVEEGVHPGAGKAREILDQYLENIRLANCVERPEVSRHVLRRAPFTLRATDFDQKSFGMVPKEAGGSAGQDLRETDGKVGSALRKTDENAGAALEETDGKAGSALRKTGGHAGNGFAENPAVSYRRGCGKYLTELRPAGEKRFVFDCQWDRFGLVLRAGESADYRYDGEDTPVELELAPGYPGGVLRLSWETSESGEAAEAAVDGGCRRISLLLKGAGSGLRLQMLRGEICVERIRFGTSA